MLCLNSWKWRRPRWLKLISTRHEPCTFPSLIAARSCSSVWLTWPLSTPCTSTHSSGSSTSSTPAWFTRKRQVSTSFVLVLIIIIASDACYSVFGQNSVLLRLSLLLGKNKVCAGVFIAYVFIYTVSFLNLWALLLNYWSFRVSNHNRF